MKLNAKQLRITPPSDEDLAQIKRRPLWIILDNVLDTYNIGGIFRLADAVSASEVILCGGSETPPSSRIHKAAVGTEKWVKWRYFPSAKDALDDLRSMNNDLRMIAVEQSPKSKPLFEFINHKSKFINHPIAVVVGHETDGVSKEALDMADMIVEIPMWGVNKSLNVIVSTAIVVYNLLAIN